VRGDVPRYVGAAAGTGFVLRQIDREAAQPTGRADTVGVIENETAAGTLGVVLGAIFELVVAVPARSTRDCEYLRDDVEVDGREDRRLLVAALDILAESGVGRRAQVRIVREGIRHRSDRRQAVGSAGQRNREIVWIALWNTQVVEVHVVEDDELLPIAA